MSSGLPEVPESWGKFAREIAAIVLLLINLVGTIWTNRKAENVQTTQVVNAAKIDDASKKVDEAKAKIDDVKADAVKVKAAVIKE